MSFAKYVVENWNTNRKNKTRKHSGGKRLPKKVVRDLAIMGIGIAGEAGEVADHIKKYIRDGKIDKAALLLELGDVHHYFTRIYTRFGFTLRQIEKANIKKLNARYAKRKGK